MCALSLCKEVFRTVLLFIILSKVPSRPSPSAWSYNHSAFVSKVFRGRDLRQLNHIALSVKYKIQLNTLCVNTKTLKKYCVNLEKKRCLQRTVQNTKYLVLIWIMKNLVWTLNVYVVCVVVQSSSVNDFVYD